MRKIMLTTGSIIISLVLIFLLIGWLSSPANKSVEEYKDNAQSIKWLELVEQKVNLGTIVKLKGKVEEITENNLTGMLIDKDGIYYIRLDTNKNREKININDNVIVYGKFFGFDDTTGFPMIETGWIEVDDKWED